MREIVACSGAPRDLGRAQGEVWRESIRRALEADGLSVQRRRPGLRGLATGRVLGTGIGREIVRHYPHQGERLAGIALAAGVSLEALVEKNRLDLSREPANGCEVGASDCAERGSGIVFRSERFDPADGWMQRRSLPEVGFGSVEVARPWSATAIAGINHLGLALALAPRKSADREPCLQATLLVQDCLQRFTRVEACVDWLKKRPSQGGSRVAMADRFGTRISVEADGSDSQPLAPVTSGAGWACQLWSQDASLRLIDGDAGCELDPLRATPPPGEVG